MLFKMYLESVKWDGEEAECFLCFSDISDNTKLNIEIPEAIGFDLQTLLHQARRSKTKPYFGVCELISQIGAKVEALKITKQQNAGSGLIQLRVGQKTFDIEMFFADVISVSIIENLPIYFDDSIFKKTAAPLDKRLLFTRTGDLTKFSFETDL